MIRMGMIGCGTMAGSFLRTLAPLGDRMTFTAFADVDEQRATDAATHWPASRGDARITTDYREMLGDVEAVIIALPHHLHHRVTLDCIDAGLHVLLEKPTAITERECLDIHQADQQSGCVLMIGYVMRFDPVWTELGRLLRERVWGDPFHVSVWTEQYTDRIRHWGSNLDTVGGGQLFSHGCHYIDLLLHWLGRPVEGTHLGTNFGTPWMDMEGTSNVAIKFDGGATGYHFGTWGARGSRLNYSVHAHATRGMLELNHADRAIYLHRFSSGPSVDSQGDLGDLRGDLGDLRGDLGDAAEIETPDRAVLLRDEAGGKHTAAEIAHFLDCIERGTSPLTDVAMSLQSLRVIWRLYEAERQKRVADLRGLGLDEFTPEPDPLLRGTIWARR